MQFCSDRPGTVSSYSALNRLCQYGSISGNMFYYYVELAVSVAVAMASIWRAYSPPRRSASLFRPE